MWRTPSTTCEQCLSACARISWLVVAELQAKRRQPIARYEVSLKEEPILTEPGMGASEDGRDDYALQRAFVNMQASYMQDLLNRTLLKRWSDERLMRRPVHEIWRVAENRFGLNTASGVVELVQRFEAITASEFKSVSHLFHQLNDATELANRNSADAINVGLIAKPLMLVKILGILPAHLWGSAVEFTPEEFTLEKVETKLCAIFGNKSKAEIKVLAHGAPVNHVDAKHVKSARATGTALGKRKAGSQPDMHQNLGGMSCFYCAGVHNDISGGPHLKQQCAKRKQDVELKVFRRNIWSYPRLVKKPRTDAKPTPKMTGKGKGKAKGKAAEQARKEVTVCPRTFRLTRATPCERKPLPAQHLLSVPHRNIYSGTRPNSVRRDKRRTNRWTRCSQLASTEGTSTEWMLKGHQLLQVSNSLLEKSVFRRCVWETR
jgi:hypothetical protein